jgi:hypothetical protein
MNIHRSRDSRQQQAGLSPRLVRSRSDPKHIVLPLRRFPPHFFVRSPRAQPSSERKLLTPPRIRVHPSTLRLDNYSLPLLEKRNVQHRFFKKTMIEI